MKLEFDIGNIRCAVKYNIKLEPMKPPKVTVNFSNPEAFKNLLENSGLNLNAFWRGFNKSYDETAKYRPKNIAKGPVDMSRPDIIPATGHDIYNYIARYGLANFQIQVIMRLDGNIDFDLLKEAVLLAIIEEPVFGCHFIEHEPAFWKKDENIDQIEYCSLEETADDESAIEAAIHRFIESPLHMDDDPMVKIRVIRSGSKDTLCFKINHACCDGTGAKEFVELISRIYSCLELRGWYIPDQKTRTRRDQDRLFQFLGIDDPEKEWIPGSDITVPTWDFPWKAGKPEKSCAAICKLTESEFNQIKKYAKAKDVKLNDIILTALYRAMLRMGKPVYEVPMMIPVTVDLRRYLPDRKTEAIRCFSGSVNTQLSMYRDESFDDTLKRVVSMMNEIKRNRPGLQSAIGLERIEKLSLEDTRIYFQCSTQISDFVSQMPPFSGDKCTPVLSNLGLISDKLYLFGSRKATDAFFISPAVRAPGLMVVSGTYNNVMTLSTSFYEEILDRSHAERLLNLIKEEMVAGCAH